MLGFEAPWRAKTGEPPTFVLKAHLPAPRVELNEEEKKRGARVLETARARGDEAAKRVRFDAYALVRGYMDADEKGRDRLRDQALASSWPQLAQVQILTWGLGSLCPERAAADLARVRSKNDNLIALQLVLRTPEAATYFLSCLGRKTLRAHGLDWALRHPDYAARAWLPPALGRGAQLRGLAMVGLRHIAAHAGREVVLQAAEPHGTEVEAALRGGLDLDPCAFWPYEPAELRFLDWSRIPRPKLAPDGPPLSVEDCEILVEAMSASTLDAIYPGLLLAKQRLEPRGLAELGWAVFEQWLAAGGPPEHGWALDGLGLVGDDAIAHELAPRVRAWPGEKRHPRAVQGLDVLLAIGTEAALMHLNGIAQKVKYKAIQEAASTRIQALARSLELSPDALADRLVPDLGLSSDGTLTLDYGPRRFRLEFDETLKPRVRDEGGKVLKSLPKPGPKDELERAGPAEARFKALKKTVRAVADQQILRLEQAMLMGRRWSPEAYRTWLLGHPLMGHLVRRLVWGQYRDKSLVGTFRVSEDGSPADAADEDIGLEPAGSIGLVHPVELEPASLAAWSGVMADYGIIQPFEQLSRAQGRLTEAEQGSSEYRRHSGAVVPVGRALGLTQRGWVRGPVLEGGAVHWFSRPLADGEHELQLYLGGVGLDGTGRQQDQDPCFDKVCIARRGEHFYLRHERPQRPLGELPAGLASDLVVTLEGLVAPSSGRP